MSSSGKSTTLPYRYSPVRCPATFNPNLKAQARQAAARSGLSPTLSPSGLAYLSTLNLFFVFPFSTFCTNSFVPLQYRKCRETSAETKMESSRIFVHGLPPNITPQDFQRHFSKDATVTDLRVIPNRRIGYVGYRSPTDAAIAVKYHNKSFIRMSRISVELARPVRFIQLRRFPDAKWLI